MEELVEIAFLNEAFSYLQNRVILDDDKLERIAFCRVENGFHNTQYYGNQNGFIRP
ncbi:MAG: hypothetical protein MJ105_06275 [Lachnospiraceae bacterium]|nr:hypothetical protein [Lachnospiraceae bacterium]